MRGGVGLGGSLAEVVIIMSDLVIYADVAVLVLPLMRICLFRDAFSLACRHKYLTLWPRIFVGLMCSVGLNMKQTTISKLRLVSSPPHP